MGLFDSKTETYVSTSVSRLIEDKLLPNSIRTGLTNGLLQDTGLTENILEEMVNSLGSRAERYYRLGARDYFYGLPSGTVYSSTQGRDEVEAVIEVLEGQQVLMEYSHFGSPNSVHRGWMTLLGEYGYQPSNNEITVLSAQQGTPVYLKNFQLVLSPEAYALLTAKAQEVWDMPPNAGSTPDRPANTTTAVKSLATYAPYAVTPGAIGETLRITGVWVEVIPADHLRLEQTVLHPLMVDVPLEDLDDGRDFFHAKYTVGGVTKYWMYEVGSGTYPTLDGFFDAPAEESGTYFPFLYFRYNFQSMADSVGLPEYTSSEKLAKRLRMDYAAVIDAISQNDNIEDVTQAMLVFAVPPDSPDPVDRRYLFDYFNQQHALQNPDGRTPTSIAIARQLSKDMKYRNSVLIKDKRFSMTLSNDGIYKQLVAGAIGPVGSYANGFRTTQETYTFYHLGLEQDQTSTVEVVSHFFQYQVTDAVYEEVQVFNLRLRYNIQGKYGVLGRKQNPVLLIPLDHSITKTYPIPVRETLYARSMHYVFNSLVEVTLEWYEQDWFKDLMIVVAVILTIISLGTYGPAAAAYIAAIAAGTVTLTAVLIGLLLTYVLPALIMMLAIKFFVKAVGAEAAFLVAVMAVVAAMYGIVIMDPAVSAPWANDLLTVSSNLVSEVSDSIQGAFGDLLKDQSAFNLQVEKQLETLEKAKDLLEVNTYLSPFTIFGEKPDDFYNRTVHSGNIGTVGISAIGSFVDVALTLPSFNDSLGAS